MNNKKKIFTYGLILCSVIFLTLCFSVFLCDNSSRLCTWAEAELSSKAKVVRFFDDQWSMDPQRVWLLSYSDESLKQLIYGRYHACDCEEGAYVKSFVGETDSEFDISRSGDVLKNETNMFSRYVIMYGSNQVYFIVFCK